MFEGGQRSVFIMPGVTDMRKAIDGLSIYIASATDFDVFSGSYFAFCNRQRNIVKVLYWQKNGFCLWQKRLDKDRFHWPDTKKDVLKIQPEELRWLLEGMDISKVKAHKNITYNAVF